MDEKKEDITEETKTKGLGIIWRIVVAITALIIIGVFVYPFIQKRLADNSASEIIIPPEIQSSIASPLATAQADPTSAEKQFELGNALYEVGAWDLAITVYQKVIELDPNYQTAYANLGAAYYQLLRFDLAASQYEKALELNPQDGESAYNLGAIYLQLALSSNEDPDPNLLNRAIIQIQNALQISPNLAEPYFSLGVAYMALNQNAEAIEAFETFLTLDNEQNLKAKQEAQRYLELLKK